MEENGYARSLRRLVPRRMCEKILFQVTSSVDLLKHFAAKNLRFRKPPRWTYPVLWVFPIFFCISNFGRVRSGSDTFWAALLLQWCAMDRIWRCLFTTWRKKGTEPQIQEKDNVSHLGGGGANGVSSGLDHTLQGAMMHSNVFKCIWICLHDCFKDNLTKPLTTK